VAQMSNARGMPVPNLQRARQHGIRQKGMIGLPST